MIATRSFIRSDFSSSSLSVTTLVCAKTHAASERSICLPIPCAGGDIDRAIQMPIALVLVELESEGFTHAVSYKVFIRTLKRKTNKILFKVLQHF
jgi:hypothetical protein